MELSLCHMQLVLDLICYGFLQRLVFSLGFEKCCKKTIKIP